MTKVSLLKRHILKKRKEIIDIAMICFVDIEHPNAINRDENARSRHLARVMERCSLFEELSGVHCLPVHFLRVNRRDLLESKVQALLISGCSTDWKEYDFGGFNELFKLLKEGKIPTLALCGGHQLLAYAFGGECGSLRPLKLGEEDPNPNYHPGMLKEWGIRKVKILKKDPLFDGLGDEIAVPERNYWEIKKMPKEFVNLASTDECQIQTIKHRQKPIYGTQFHPESYDEQHPDGKTVLTNFFRIAGI